MRIQIEPTDRVVVIDGTVCRAWSGVTETGVQCVVFVHRIAVDPNQDTSEFDRELIEGEKPATVAEFTGMRQDWG